MKQSYILISPVCVLAILTTFLLGGTPVFASVNLFGQFLHSTSSPVYGNAPIYAQGLGSSLPLENVGTLQLYLSVGSGSGSLTKTYFQCSTTEALMYARNFDCGRWTDAFMSSATPTLTTTETLITLTSSTTIPIVTGRYYSFELQGTSGASGLRAWGNSTSTNSDTYSDGRCFSSNNGLGAGHDCYDPYSASSIYGIRDFYFVFYGQAGKTRVTEPIPSWNEIVAPTGTTTMDISWGADFFLSPLDGEEFNVNQSLKYVEGGIFSPPYFQENNVFGSGSTQIVTTTTIPVQLGLYQLHYIISKPIDNWPDKILYSTTTYFILGSTDINASSTGDVGLEDIKDRIDAVDCTWVLTSPSSIIDCLWDYFIVILRYMVDYVVYKFNQFLDYLLTRVPWGYAYRVYYIFNNPDPDYVLETISVPVPSQFGSSVWEIDPWSSFDDAMVTLDSVTSTATSTTLKSELLYYWNLGLGLMFGLWIFRKLIALGHTHKKVTHLENTKHD